MVITPGSRNSYQRHQQRQEIWVIISGVGRFLIDDIWIEGSVGDVIKIPAQSKHRWHNVSDSVDLVLIEVQIGSYFGEDDEERLDDDYGRAGTIEVCENGKLVD